MLHSPLPTAVMPPRHMARGVHPDVVETWHEIRADLEEYIMKHELDSEEMEDEVLADKIRGLLEPMDRWTESALHDVKRELIKKKIGKEEENKIKLQQALQEEKKKDATPKDEKKMKGARDERKKKKKAAAPPPMKTAMKRVRK